MDKYIQLYQETEIAQYPEAVKIIREILIENKSKKFSWNKTINQIQQHFLTLQKNSLVNNKELAGLLKAFKDGLINYERDHKLLAIPNELKTAFDKAPTIKISFNEYVERLAGESAFSKINSLFYHSRSFQLMYEIGKFDGYDNFPIFDGENLIEKSESYDLFEEVHKIVYPENYQSKQNLNQKNKSQSNFNKVFEFNKDSIEFLKSEKFFSNLIGDYFSDYEISYVDFKNVFFEDPNSHDSVIQLDCETTLFALLLDQLQKQRIAQKISYTRIENHKLFLTKKGKYLSRANISNSIRISSKAHKDVVNSTINSIKKTI